MITITRFINGKPERTLAPSEEWGELIDALADETFPCWMINSETGEILTNRLENEVFCKDFAEMTKNDK